MKRLTKNVVVVLVLVVGVLGLFGGCGEKQSNEESQSASGLTESQRDSAIAGSNLPGANAVGRALAISDSAKARAQRAEGEEP